jgi:hypothetical protein
LPALAIMNAVHERRSTKQRVSPLHQPIRASGMLLRMRGFRALRLDRLERQFLPHPASGLRLWSRANAWKAVGAGQRLVLPGRADGSDDSGAGRRDRLPPPTSISTSSALLPRRPMPRPGRFRATSRRSAGCGGSAGCSSSRSRVSREVRVCVTTGHTRDLPPLERAGRGSAARGAPSRAGSSPRACGIGRGACRCRGFSPPPQGTSPDRRCEPSAFSTRKVPITLYVKSRDPFFLDAETSPSTGCSICRDVAEGHRPLRRRIRRG